MLTLAGLQRGKAYSCGVDPLICKEVCTPNL